MNETTTTKKQQAKRRRNGKTIHWIWFGIEMGMGWRWVMMRLPFVLSVFPFVSWSRGSSECESVLFLVILFFLYYYYFDCVCFCRFLCLSLSSSLGLSFNADVCCVDVILSTYVDAFILYTVSCGVDSKFYDCSLFPVLCSNVYHHIYIPFHSNWIVWCFSSFSFFFFDIRYYYCLAVGYAPH